MRLYVKYSILATETLVLFWWRLLFSYELWLKIYKLCEFYNIKFKTQKENFGFTIFTFITYVMKVLVSCSINGSDKSGSSIFVRIDRCMWYIIVLSSETVQSILINIKTCSRLVTAYKGATRWIFWTFCFTFI